jgi:hypothetical protein
MEGVKRGAAALGICWDVVDAGDVYARTCRTDQLGIAFQAGHELANRPSVCFSDTLAYPHIGLTAASNFQTVLRDSARILAPACSSSIVPPGRNVFIIRA